MKTIRVLICVLIGIRLFATSGLQAGTRKPSTNIPQVESYVLNSGIHNGRPDGIYMAYKGQVQVPDAAWLRLYFRSDSLGAGSYILVTSLKDGAHQRITASTLAQWNKSSAYFDGNTVDVELHVAPAASHVSFGISKIMFGTGGSGGMTVMSICGSQDDRSPSTYAGVGRLYNSSTGAIATGWIAGNGKYVTAGHVTASWYNIIQDEIFEFNVPNSLPDGTIQFSAPQDQYTVSGIYAQDNKGTGDDWGLFGVNPNSQTGLQPIQEQQAFYNVEQNDNASTMQVIG